MTRIPLRYYLLMLSIPLMLIALLRLISGSSAMGTLSSGRSVEIKSDSHSITARFNKDTATIHTSGKTIIVGPTNISIDSIDVATIDEQARRVQVDVKNGTATFLADGKPVEAIKRWHDTNPSPPENVVQEKP